MSEVQPCLTHEWKVEGGQLVCEQCPILGPSVVDALAAIFEKEHRIHGTPKERLEDTDRALNQALEWVRSLEIYRIKVEAEGWAVKEPAN